MTGPASSLPSVLNARDIGGMSAGSGATLRADRILRSGSLSAIEEDDLRHLVDTVGLRTVIDLRRDEEIGGRKHSLDVDGVNVQNLPLLAEHGDSTSEIAELSHRSLAALYNGYLDRSAGVIVEILRVLSDETQLPALIHCTAGKDRTGVVLAVLQELLEVPREQIVADYARSAADMGRVLDLLRERAKDSALTFGEELAWLFGAEAHTMEAFLDELERRGGARMWVLANGADEEMLDRLVANLTTAPDA